MNPVLFYRLSKMDEEVETAVKNITDAESTTAVSQDIKSEPTSVEEVRYGPRFTNEKAVQYSQLRSPIGRASYSIKKNMLGESWYVCNEPNCRYSHQNSVTIQDHINEYHKQEILRCYLCPKVYYRIKSLYNHIYVGHKAKALQCDEPGCTFKSLIVQYFEKHFKEKHPEREVPAHLRPFDPSVPSILVNCKRGEKTTDGTGAFIPKLSRRSEETNELLKHALVKKDKDGRVLKYKCKECSKTYKLRNSFKVHYKVEHLGFRYKCDICSKEFPNMSNISAHKKSVHGIQSGPRGWASIKSSVCPVQGCKFSVSKYEDDKQMQKHLIEKHGAVYDEENHALVMKQAAGSATAGQ